MTKKTNIVFILSDDHGYWANGCYGNPEIQTPNIDKLAEEGMLFNNFFCASPVCSPARASIMTGKIPSQHGVHDWIASGCIKREDYDTLDVSKKRYIGSLGSKAEEDYREVPENETVPMTMTSQYRFISHEKGEPQQYLKNQTAYTDLLATDGYACGIIGKWHLGDSKHAQHGIRHWSVIGKGGCIYHLPDFYRNGKLVMEDQYITDLITEEGISFIEEQVSKEKPFYVGLHYTAPHGPWIKEDQPVDIWQSYDSCSFDFIEDTPIHPWQVEKRHPGYHTAEGRRYMQQGYYTAVTAMDKCIGEVIDKLDELGIREETMIVFTSDNGMNLGQHGIWGKGNGTFPQNMFDTSVKVPMIISQPNKIKENQRIDGLFSHYDIMPTLLDYVGIDAEYGQEKLPGRSFSNLLTDDSYEEQNDIVIFDEYGPVRMIRDSKWKYIHRFPNGPHELYDLVNNPEETINLIDDSSYSYTISSFRTRLMKWFEKYVVPNRDGAILPVTGDGQSDLSENYFKGIKSFK